MKWWSSLMRAGSTDLVLVLGLIGILGVLFVPIPAALLDFLLVANFSLGMLVLLLTLYADKPLRFSTFPSLLLITTLFRLSLNIATTRLILSDAHAGNVIQAIGSYVVGGNYVIGLVVFLILVVVQYVVVTNGAQRVAEVAARFTLDSMPGKQMSIDADLNMGLIDEEEAKRRRSNIEKEANFYGAMDGATKFVKGDAIAGIIIILINIIGGLIIGLVQHGMPWSQALHTFTLLTVGDGIVTQIPSLVIAVATGLIITRAATDANLSQELANQVLSYPKPLFVVAATLALLLLLPGLPVLPILALLAVFFTMYWYARRRRKSEDGDADNEGNLAQTELDPAALMQTSPLEILFGKALFNEIRANSSALNEALEEARKSFAVEYGYLTPKMRITDSGGLAEYEYCIHFNGVRVAKGLLMPGKLLAINPGGERAVLDGVQTEEPTYRLPAIWIDQEQREQAIHYGYTLVAAENVLITHFVELLKRHAFRLLTRTETEKLIQVAKRTNGVTADELLANSLTYSDVQYVLQELLRERVSIKYMEIILDAITDLSRSVKDKAEIAERIREKLGSQIMQGLHGDEDELSVLLLEQGLEKTLLQALRKGEGGSSLLVEPSQLERLMQAIAKHCDAMMANNKMPVILCTSALRRPLKAFVERVVPALAVIGMNEVPDSVNIRTFATVVIR